MFIVVVSFFGLIECLILPYTLTLLYLFSLAFARWRFQVLKYSTIEDDWQASFLTILVLVILFHKLLILFYFCSKFFK